MNWFINLKISSKLLIAVLIIALFAVVAGGIGILNLTSLKQADTGLYQDNALALEYSGETAVNILQLQYSVLQYRYATTPALMDEIKNSILEYQKTVGDNTAKLVDKITSYSNASGELTGLISEISTVWGSYSDNLNLFFQYTDEGMTAKAMSQRDTLNSIGNEIRDKILKSMSLIAESASERAAGNAIQSDRAILIMIIVIAFVLIVSIVLFLISFEKASPFMLLEYNPASFAFLSKAAVLYQPAVAVLLSAAGLSKNTPMVAAPAPNADVILEASPKPVEAPITSTLFGPGIGPCPLT
jgi:methyl-accepting chemotaxis protein